MELIDGKLLAQTIEEEIAVEVTAITSNEARPPHLAAVLVGEDPVSQSFVRNKSAPANKLALNQPLSEKKKIGQENKKARPLKKERAYSLFV